MMIAKGNPRVPLYASGPPGGSRLVDNLDLLLGSLPSHLRAALERRGNIIGLTLRVGRAVGKLR